MFATAPACGGGDDETPIFDGNVGPSVTPDSSVPSTPGTTGGGVTGGGTTGGSPGGTTGGSPGGTTGGSPGGTTGGSPGGTTGGSPGGTTGGSPGGTTGGSPGGTTGGSPGGTTGGSPGGTTGGTPGGTTGGTAGGGGACLDGIKDFDKAGPFKFTAKPQGVIKFWVPEVPAGCKVPVIHLANGTGASCSNYQDNLNRLASHGFLTACYENTNTGAGTQGLMAFEKAISAFPDLADMRLGSMGHSQGGQAAFTVLQLTEAKFGDKAIYAGLAMQPASGFGTQPAGGSWQSLYAKIKSPMFMFSGTADILVSESWVQQAFTALADTTEAYWYSAVGATHVPTPQEHTNYVEVAWFRWKLLGDAAACEYFKKLPDNDKWDKRKEQAAKPCQ
jgi:dienelactone hydrolase